MGLRRRYLLYTILCRSGCPRKEQSIAWWGSPLAGRQHNQLRCRPGAYIRWIPVANGCMRFRRASLRICVIQTERKTSLWGTVCFGIVSLLSFCGYTLEYRISNSKSNPHPNFSSNLKRDPHDRYYTSTRVLELKYNLKAIAGNFIISEWDAYGDALFLKLNRPFPIFVSRALNQTHLPRDDCASTSGCSGSGCSGCSNC